MGGVSEDVIAPPPGELFSETNDNSVAILLTYGTACVLLAGDAEVREEYVAGSYRAYTPGDPVWPVMIAGDIPVYWKPPIRLRSLTPIFTPTHPNIIRLKPTLLHEDLPKILVWQGILRHKSAPG